MDIAQVHIIIVGNQEPARGPVGRRAPCPVGNRGIIGIKSCLRILQRTNTQKVEERDTNDTAMTHHHNSFPLVLSQNTVKRGPHAQRKLSPVLSTGSHLPKRRLPEINLAVLLSILLYVHAVSSAVSVSWVSSVGSNTSRVMPTAAAFFITFTVRAWAYCT